MASAKSNAHSTGEKSALRMVLFFMCFVVCIGCMYLLFDFQHSLQPKLSGELILGQAETVDYKYQDAPIRSFLFEYFGLLSYLLCLMIVYVGYFIFLRPTDIWHVDFYRTSLRILGFNILFLSLAAILSRYMDLFSTGAGGLLGDMLILFSDSVLPQAVSFFIFVLLAFCGLTLLFGSTPVGFFEYLGDGVFKVLHNRNEHTKSTVSYGVVAPSDAVKNKGKKKGDDDSLTASAQANEAGSEAADANNAIANSANFANTANLSNLADVAKAATDSLNAANMAANAANAANAVSAANAANNFADNMTAQNDYGESMAEDVVAGALAGANAALAAQDQEQPFAQMEQDLAQAHFQAQAQAQAQDFVPNFAQDNEGLNPDLNPDLNSDVSQGLAQVGQGAQGIEQDAEQDLGTSSFSSDFFAQAMAQGMMSQGTAPEGVPAIAPSYAPLPTAAQEQQAMQGQMSASESMDPPEQMQEQAWQAQQALQAFVSQGDSSNPNNGMYPEDNGAAMAAGNDANALYEPNDANALNVANDFAASSASHYAPRSAYEDNGNAYAAEQAYDYAPYDDSGVNGAGYATGADAVNDSDINGEDVYPDGFNGTEQEAPASLAPFAHGQLYDSQAIAEPMHGNELDAAAEAEVSAMPAMPVMPHFTEPLEDLPYEALQERRKLEAEAAAAAAVMQVKPLTKEQEEALGIKSTGDETTAATNAAAELPAAEPAATALVIAEPAVVEQAAQPQNQAQGQVAVPIVATATQTAAQTGALAESEAVAEATKDQSEAEVVDVAETEVAPLPSAEPVAAGKATESVEQPAVKAGAPEPSVATQVATAAVTAMAAKVVDTVAQAATAAKTEPVATASAAVNETKDSAKAESAESLECTTASVADAATKATAAAGAAEAKSAAQAVSAANESKAESQAESHAQESKSSHNESVAPQVEVAATKTEVAESAESTQATQTAEPAQAAQAGAHDAESKESKEKDEAEKSPYGYGTYAEKVARTRRNQAGEATDKDAVKSDQSAAAKSAAQAQASAEPAKAAVKGTDKPVAAERDEDQAVATAAAADESVTVIATAATTTADATASAAASSAVAIEQSKDADEKAKTEAAEAEAKAKEEKEEEEDNAVHTIVQRTDPEVFAAQLAANRKAREEAEAKAKAEAEAKAKAEAEAKAKEEAEAKAKAEEEARLAAEAEAKAKAEAEAKAQEEARLAAEAAAKAEAEAKAKAEEEARLAAEAAAKAEVEAKAKAEAEAKAKAEAEAKAKAEAEKPIYAGTYASRLKQQQEQTGEAKDKDSPYITPGTAKTNAAEGDDATTEAEEDHAPSTIIQDTRKEFEAAQERARAEAEAKAKAEEEARLAAEAEARLAAEAEAKAKAEEEARLAAEAAAKAKAEEEARLAAEAAAKAQAEEEARLAAEAAAKAKVEEEARLAAEAAAKAQAEEEARLAAEAAAKAQAEEEARLAAEAAAKAQAEEEARLAAEAAEEARIVAEARAAEEARLAEEKAQAATKAEAAAQESRKSKESAILEVLSNLASELKSVTDSSLTSRHAHDNDGAHGALGAASSVITAGAIGTAAANTAFAGSGFLERRDSGEVNVNMGSGLDREHSVLAGVQVSSNNANNANSVNANAAHAFAHGAYGANGAQGAEGLGMPESHADAVHMATEQDEDFLKYATARSNAQQAGAAFDEPVTVDLFNDDEAQGPEHGQGVPVQEQGMPVNGSVYAGAHAGFNTGAVAGAGESAQIATRVDDYEHGSGVAAMEQGYAANEDADADNQGIDDFVTGATYPSSAAGMRTQNFNFAQLAQAKEAAAAAAAAAAQAAAQAERALASATAEELSAALKDMAAMVDGPDEGNKGDNIISFNKYNQPESPSYEMNKLTSAFIPEANDGEDSAHAHLSRGDLNNLYEQEPDESTAPAAPSAPAATASAAVAPVATPAAAAPVSEADSGDEYGDGYDYEDEGEDEDDFADELYDEATDAADTAHAAAQGAAGNAQGVAGNAAVQSADAANGEDDGDYEYDDGDDDADYEDEGDDGDEGEDIAESEAAPRSSNQGVNQNVLQGQVLPANQAPAQPLAAGMQPLPQGQALYSSLPTGQQVQYMRMPNGQYVPVMANNMPNNGMVYPNVPNVAMPAVPMAAMPPAAMAQAAMPQYVQMPNGQYVPVMQPAANVVYPSLATPPVTSVNPMSLANQALMASVAAMTQGVPAANAAAAVNGTVAGADAASVASAEAAAGAGAVEPVPDVADYLGDGLPESALAMVRELLDDEDEDVADAAPQSQAGAGAAEAAGGAGAGAANVAANAANVAASAVNAANATANAVNAAAALGVTGAQGVGLPTAGHDFMGAHNSSSSNLPSYMAGVAQGSVSFDTPKSLSLCSVPRHNYDAWRPSLDLLARSHEHVETSIEELEKTSERINAVLHSFGVKATVADYLTGPVITRFDLDLAPGVKSSAISSIETELCRNLLVSNVRVVPIIDGSSYVGLEVPNAKRQLITLGDMVTSREFEQTKASLPMCLGASVVGEPVVKDLAETPHLLVAGTTGSGKSAGLNTMLISLLLKRSPAELRLILVDPKQLEFSIYKDLPHLLTPVITDVAEKTPIALNWCVDEMERRFKLMSKLGVRKLAEYNELIKNEQAQGRGVPDPLWTAEMGPVAQNLKPLPWIVVVVEEFADLMAQSGRKKDKDTPESLIARLSAKSRAAGIHLVLVTQTPRSEVVTGMIKANFPSRIAFTVQSRLDSTIVLDDKGAETLLGNGDMLYKFTGANSPTRAHGAFTSNNDVKEVVDAWRQEAGAPEYLEDVIAVPEEENENDTEEKIDKLDVKFDQAVELVHSYMASQNKVPSVSDIQAELGVGWPRAKKIFKQLTSEGVIN